ncbi:MAG: hypothetical protein RL757_365 [Bacteroidota bacterium]
MKWLSFVALLSLTTSVFGQTGISHDAWNNLLQNCVSETGDVDYKGLKEQKTELDAYCKMLSEISPKEDWSKEEKLTFWMNAYNAFTIQLIVSNYPLKSITQLDDEKTWDVKRIKIGGKKYSLNDIENNILRKLGDARIHFGINCAAKSCPPVHNEAFTPENVNEKLEFATRSFINNKLSNEIGSKTVKVSKIFKWYAADFPNLISFLNTYSDKKINKTAAITFQDYDWSLNGK